MSEYYNILGVNKTATKEEIKKAVDFAGDIQGGAVVFHTGEWQRPFSEQDWNKGECL